MKSCRDAWFATWTCLLLTAPTHAQQGAWPVARGPSREPASHQFDRAVIKQAPRPFLEDASACILYAGSSHIVEADGSVETITHEITRLNGRKGIEELGEYASISFNPAYQKLTLNEARIHKVDGKIVSIEPRHVQLRDAVTDYQVYDPEKQLIISFPNLRAGDVYEVKWTVRGKSPEFGKQFFLRYSLGSDNYPTVRDELRIVLPGDKPLQHALLNGRAMFHFHEQKGQKVYTWSMNDVPALTAEDDAPSREEQRVQVVCSTFASWQEVAQWKAKLREACWQCTPSLRKLLEKVVEAESTPLAKARALTYWVRRNIRYVSRGPGGLGYTPHTPGQVLGNLYGDCKDQAQLLAVMLQEIGLPVYLVTLGVRGDGQVVPEVPSPWGTHAILLVKIDGQDHWIDTTASHGPWDALPRACRNRQVYVTRGQDIQILKTPAWTWADHRYDENTSLYLQPDGTTKLTRALTYHGGAATARRDAWLETPVGERRRLMTLELQDANGRARLTNLEVDDRNLLDTDQPVTARVAYQIPRHLSGDNVLEGSLTDSVVWNRLLAYNVDPERKLPLELPGPFESKHRFVIQLPAVFRLETLPKAAEVRSRWGFLKLEVHEALPRRLELVSHFRLENHRIELAHFAEFQKFHEEVLKAYRVWIAVKPTRELADAPLLETLLVLAPGADRLSARTLVKLYFDHERLKDARRVLELACCYFPADQEFWAWKVKAAAHAGEEESIYRHMVRIFPDETRFQLALGAILVKRQRHADACVVLEPLTESDVGSQAHFHLARSYFTEKKFSDTLRHLQGIKVDQLGELPPGAVAHLLARVNEKLGNLDEALDAYRRASAADPESLAYLADLIRLQMGRSKNGATLDLVRAYTLKAGKDPVPLAQAADFHFLLGRYDEAFELADRAGAQRTLGLIHYHKQAHEQAIFHLERAGNDAVVGEALLNAYLAVGQLSRAERLAVSESSLTREIKKLARRRELAIIEAKFPAAKKAAATRVIDACLCAERAHAAASPAVVEKILAKCFVEEAVDFGPAFSLRGLLHLEQGRYRLAQADAAKALTLAPADGRALFVRGRVRLALGDRLALEDLEQAAKIGLEKDAQTLHWLAAAQFQYGHKERALATQGRAVRLQPQNAELLEQLRVFQEGLKK